MASFLGGALGVPGGGGVIWDAPTGGVGILVRQGIPARQIYPPKGHPGTRRTPSAKPCGTPPAGVMPWCG